MRRPMLSTSMLGLGLLLVGTSVAAATSLTRIETRPFYGATVSVEEGVRVFRPLPPTRYMIINPDGKTPLNLTFEERNVVVHQYQYTSEAEPNELRFGYGGGFSPGKRHRAVRHRHPSGHLIHVPRAAAGTAR